MNFRSRALLDLAYELECTLRISGICEGGTGEPCHANWQLWGKNGGGEKAPDWAIASGCRACHMAIDQGSKLSAELREHYWMRGHVRTMNELWGRGLIAVAAPTPESYWAARNHEAMASGLLTLPAEAKPLRDERSTLEVSTTQQNDAQAPADALMGVFGYKRRKKGSKRGTHCQRPSKVLPRRVV